MTEKDEPLASAEAQPKRRGRVMPRGRPFKKGQSGNPSGKPKDTLALADLARSHTAEAIEKLVEIMRSRKTSSVARVRAISELLDRGHGRPMQQVKVTPGTAIDVHDLDAAARRLAVLFHRHRLQMEQPRVLEVLPADTESEGK